MNKVIIADASPLIAFGRLKCISILVKTLGKIIVPVSVIQECLLNPGQPGAKEISEALNKKIIQLHDDPDMHEHTDLFDVLGLGEANAIILASKLKMGLLIDEKLGRKIAQRMHVPVIGTAGVLLLAKKKKIIKKIEPFICELKEKGYYLSDELVHAVLLKAKEIK